jgi:hypothetical protein
MKGESFLMRSKEDGRVTVIFRDGSVHIVVFPNASDAQGIVPELPHHRCCAFWPTTACVADASYWGQSDKACCLRPVGGGASAKAAPMDLGDVSRLLDERRCELSETFHPKSFRI